MNDFVQELKKIAHYEREISEEEVSNVRDIARTLTLNGYDSVDLRVAIKKLESAMLMAGDEKYRIHMRYELVSAYSWARWAKEECDER